MYTAEEKQRMERVLAAFGACIDEDKEYDICYSKKIGYFRFFIDKKYGHIYAPKIIEGFDALLDELFFEVSDDVRELDLTGEFHDDIELFPVEITETRRRLLLILNTLDEDKEYSIDRMEYYLEHVND